MKEEDDGGRAKTIGLFGSVVITMNNMLGPGMLGLSLVYQQCGWVFAVGFMLLFWVISTFCSTMLCEAMAIVPGNRKYNKRIEYATLVRHFFGFKFYAVAQFFYVFSLQVLNIASITVSAQVMDSFLVFIFGESYALQLIPSVKWVATSNLDFYPFEESSLIITLGYLSTLVILMPAGFLDLDDNIYIQFTSFLVMIGSLIAFTVQFVSNGLTTRLVPAFGDNPYGGIGLLLFGFAFVVTVPSWVNEKEDRVSVNKALWTASTSSVLIFLYFGLMGALAYPGLQTANLLTTMSSDSNASSATQIFVFLFTFFEIGFGIPLFSIYIRQNLFAGGVCNKTWSAFWGTAAPWLISWLFLQGQAFTIFENWSALVINGVINFVIPFIVYFKSKRDDYASFDVYDDYDEFYQEAKSSKDTRVEHHRALPAALTASTPLWLVPTILGGSMTIVLVAAVALNLVDIFKN